MRIKQVRLSPDREKVFRLMDCYENSPVYQEVVEAYESMLDRAEREIRPDAVFMDAALPEKLRDAVRGPRRSAALEGKPEENRAVFALMTVGDGLSKWSARLFEEGEYLEGTLADAMADAALFELDGIVSGEIRKWCHERGLGAKKRLEAPQSLPMSAQRVVWEITDAQELLGVDILPSGMLNPEKSMALIYLLSDSKEDKAFEHNCRECPAVNCKTRKEPYAFSDKKAEEAEQ